MASKRKFLDSYSKEFTGIKRAKNDDEFHCVPCNENIALGSTGKFAVIRHFATDKHKKNAKAANTTKGIAAFAHSSAPTSIELQTAAAEGAFAFHICRHNQSFASADCLSSDGFFTKIFPDSTIAKKYSSAQTKTAAIISALQLFYQSTLEYVDKWFRTERYRTQIGWLTLTTHQLDHEEIIELASEYAPDMTDALFDEISQVNQILKEVPEAEFEQLTTEQKWQQIFNADLPCLYKLVSKFLSIPVSNAFVERVFSLCSAQWTDVRNSLKVETSKLAKDSGNFKAGGRFKVKRPNGRFAYECAGNDGTNGWHAVRISNGSTGMVTLDTSFSIKPLIINASNYPKINITEALTSDGQSFGVEFLKAIHFGALMIDFNEMAFQIAVLEIRQSKGKKDTKLCKTKCAAKMPKAQHVNHLGINCMEIEFPIEIAKFSLSISTSPYWIACAAHQRDNTADHLTTLTKYMEVARQDQFNACSKVPTSPVCNNSLELYACYKSIKNQRPINKEIAEVCQKHLNQASFVAGFRVRMCVHREAEKQMLAFETILEFSSSEQIIKPAKKFPIKFGLKQFVPFSFIEIGHQPIGEGEDGAKLTIGLGVQQLMEKTCITFTFDASDAKEGIQIIDDGDRTICGLSYVGQTSGWQTLSINDCHDGYAGPHELLHALGLHHEHQRNDSYNFIKLNPFDNDNSAKTDNYEFAYDFGSIMHYPPEGSHNIYKRITLNRFYQQTIGQREEPSFKDFAIINSIYCNDTCGAQNVCQNGGYPNPHRCWECFCPDGYGGWHCETLEEDFGCISVGAHFPRELEADWQTRTFNPSIKCVRNSECKCHWRIEPKNGKKLRIQFKRLGLLPHCSQMPCGLPFFEIKFRKDKRARGARLCCPDAIAQMAPSQNWIEAEKPGTDIIIFARLIPMDTVTIELTYETDGAKIVPSDQCQDPRNLFIKQRNPGVKVLCRGGTCPRSKVPFSCGKIFGYYAVVNGRTTNKINIMIECFKREDNPTSYWGYWEDKEQDPIHIDDIQCVKPFMPKFKSTNVENSHQNLNGTIGHVRLKYKSP
uniref:Metalloendopeptidase n=1 Tax=Globodera rostochiensis TaxID=31243 RepID=A0A914ID34_GLORO